MATDTFTVKSGIIATLVVSAGSGPHLVQNLDSVNPVYIGDEVTLRAVDQSGVIPIPAGGSYAVDGLHDLYAVTTPGITVQVATLLGGMSSFRGLTVNNGQLVIPIKGAGFIINVGGQFFYSGTPAHGNLADSIVPGTVNVTDDPILNNTAFPGITNYGAAGAFAQLFNGSLTLSDGTFPFVIDTNTGRLRIGLGTSEMFFIPVGTSFKLVPVDPVAGGNTPEDWHSLGTLSGTGSANLIINQARYRLTVFNELEIDIVLTASGTTTAGTAITFSTTLNSAYWFTESDRNYPLGFNGTITTATNNAAVRVSGAGSGSPGQVKLELPSLPINTVITASIKIPLEA